MPEQPDYYEVLQVAPAAELEIIKAAHRKLAQSFHPDVNPTAYAHVRLRELNEALAVLSDPLRRSDYDRQRKRHVAQRAMAAKPPILVVPPAHPKQGIAVSLPTRLRRLPAIWLAIAAAAGVALLVIEAFAMQLGSDSGGGGQSSGQTESGESDRLINVVHAGPGQPAAPTPMEAAAEPPPIPTPAPSPGPAAPTTPQVLSAVRDDTRPRPRGSAGTAAATPTPAPLAVVPPATGPGTPPPSTPAPVVPAPLPPVPPPPPQCSAGAPQISERGNQVTFSNGNVIQYDPGEEGALVVDVAATTLSLNVAADTEVRGDLDGATVVSGQGRRSHDGTITAQLVEVECPE